MKLDECFRHLESIILLSEPLYKWVTNNQEEMKYYKMFHKNSTKYYENEYCNLDVIILEKMANACFSWIESPSTLSISNEKKANYAALSISGIYEQESEKLSEGAKQKYYISVEKREKTKKIVKTK